MYKKIILKFILIYTIITSIISYFFIRDYNNTVKNYLEEKTISQYLKFKAIYNKHKELANVIYDADINTKEVLEIFKDSHKASDLEKNIIREKLLKKLDFQYQKLRRYNLKQLHFHLPNNESFLRMHRPNKFGDNLTNIRQTIMYVNKNKRYIHGFEEGRIFNGFRFVYPLFWENKHIGSVEVSFSALALIESLYDTYKLNAHFLIKKSVVDKKVFKEEKKNYILSPQKEFYYEKSIYEKYKPISIIDNPIDTTKQTLKGEPYTIYIEKLNLTKTAIPIKNPISKEVVAALCICEKDEFISSTKKSLTILLFSLYIFLFFIFYFFYRQRLNNEKLKRLNMDLDKRIELEIKKSREKDLHILNQSKIVAVGEVLNNIAHQWRQPLNIITTSASGLKVHKELNTLDNKTFDFLTDGINEQAQYLSKVIESFKRYLGNDAYNNKKKKFSLQDRIENAFDIINSTFKYNNIVIFKEYEKEELFIKGKQNEFLQTIIDILNNSKDALLKNNQASNRKVLIKLEQENNFAKISIEDNAGGIKEDIIDKIFEPYFTTKHEAIGTGMSLYRAYEIITINLKGQIYVKNIKEGVGFYIKIPLA